MNIQDTNFYRIVLRKHSDDPRMVIAFDNWQSKSDIDAPSFGESFLPALSINHITVKPGQNNWFQEPEVDDVIAAIREVTPNPHRIGSGGLPVPSA